MDQITLITWKDEKWTANKEELKIINSQINQNRPPSRTMIERIIEKVFYILGWIVIAPLEAIRWISSKFKKK